ncbi:MAG: periplasmic sensor signal transduction histidine kinase [Acidobacteriaceae bacterium]|nr:periplasmic sensor signal transduction histidine kinase [Acidobacteriaceae bacterium]
MKPLSKERLVSWGTVLALACILIVLARLQYRWSDQVSQATTAQMQAALQNSMVGFRQDLTRELGRVGMEMQPAPIQGKQLDLNGYVQQYLHWRQTASHPELVDAIYIWQPPVAQQKSGELLKMNAEKGRFESVLPPKEFETLLQRLEEMSANFTRSGVLGGLQAFAAQRSGASPAMMPWAIDQDIPALIGPVSKNVNARDFSPSGSWVIVTLNSKVLEQHLLPELTTKYFSSSAGLTDEIAVVAGTREQPKIIYATTPDFSAEKALDVDAALNLWRSPPPGDPGRTGVNVFRPTTRQLQNEGRGSSSNGARDIDIPEPVRLIALHYSLDQTDWHIVVKRRKGSLEAAIAALRWRNLAISFGILTVLAVTMALTVMSSYRARRLAQLQIDFVTGISHELRTPLAVISSAAENIADGLVGNKQQMVKYGAVIRDQSKQLAQLVEQVLLYSASKQSQQDYVLNPVQVNEVVQAALSNTSSVLNAANFSVERDIDPNLPEVAADFSALTQCLQNLITNAVKYGAQSQWMAIRASARNGKQEPHEVMLTVEDRGMGIDSSDLPHIFEPFYRGTTAKAAQIHGTGLGLALVERTMEAMNGRLTVSSEPGKGASFTLHLTVFNGNGGAGNSGSNHSPKGQA